MWDIHRQIWVSTDFIIGNTDTHTLKGGGGGGGGGGSTFLKDRPFPIHRPTQAWGPVGAHS